MNDCEHDLSEREGACADGMCPLCLAAELAQARAERDAAQGDVQRMTWLEHHLYAADFRYGDPPTSVIVFEWPVGVPIGVDLRAAIDAARSA